jgi:hypothetical protein
MVRPVRIRIAGGLLAVSRENRPDRCSLSGLWAVHHRGNSRWQRPEIGAARVGGICGGTIQKMV